MLPYFSLSGSYDDLTADVPYERFADFYEQVFLRLGRKPRTVLDLACGTGTLTRMLSNRGYELIGVDASPEMLSVALEKTLDCEVRPLLICQRAEELDLYGTVDAAVCSLDSVNYIPPKLLPEVFRRVHLFLEPGGVFIFDVIAPQMLRAIDGQAFVDENDDVFCVWRAEYVEPENACYYGMDIFSLERGLWRRSSEEHIEYAHDLEALREVLICVGFHSVEVFGGFEFEKPRPDDRRIFFTAIKGET